MKKLLILLLSVFLMFSFCKKSSSNNEEEDSISIEITVTKNGSPVENIFVYVDVLVWENVTNRDAGTHTDSYEATSADNATTNVYGKVTFNYNNKSIPSRNGVVLQKVTIKEFSVTKHEEDLDTVVAKNGSLSLSYEIE